MKLVAMMVIRNEADRYLEWVIPHLLAFCDEIRILDDGSDDDWSFGWEQNDRVVVKTNPVSNFYNHEGMTRQQLLDWTMEGEPTHILAIDADEFIADGPLLRSMMEAESSRTGIWKLRMTEIWGADDDSLIIRTDGLWPPRPVGIAYAVPRDLAVNRQTKRHYRMHDAALACGRTPLYITMRGNRTVGQPICDILHFGWACRADRQARYARYQRYDGGRHHKNTHLESIMWPDSQVKTARIPWPDSLDRAALLDRVNRT